ncbi:MAG: MarR family transcriptional regulator [Sulfobacillus acidophilus]|uniref:MarR family transcriptional regulator n=1 Tax=Sulfobacillus acidophilus TaxID=53633 RepID=A0A2T2WL89_9FIRM|nr:MAG: MarR family transcriptional regulator [Sulfobacillus acidophilus]
MVGMGWLTMRLATEIFDQIFVVVRDFERRFREQGSGTLSTTQFQALSILEESEPVTAMTMAQKLRIAPPTATRALDSLGRRQLVLKERDPQDRRIVWLRLTDRGEHALLKEREHQLAWMVNLLDALTRDEQEQFLDLMRKIASRVDSPS